MKRLYLASLMVLGLMTTVGCSPAIAQCVNGACGLASVAYSTASSFQSCSQAGWSPGRGCHGRRSRQSCQPVQWSQAGQCQNGQCGVVSQAPASPPIAQAASTPAPAQTTSAKCDDALAEVNAARAQRGLRPYVNDPVLNEAARKCAAYRASIHCQGHCPGQRGDFAYLPSGYDTNGVVGGCAGLTPDWGFQACAMYDNYTFCGAAWVMGSDGRKYCHLFAR